MAVVIKKIELNNWFGYKGSYDENTFEFSDGVNIIVASNDVGKSKLHNAFRWIVSDKVILKDKENKYSLEDIDLNTVSEILNHDIRNQLKNEETATIGVRLTFEEIDRRGDTFNRIITKELICKKDVNRITVSNPITKVQRNERGNIRTAPESFEEVKNKIIRQNLKDFFLVQGESLEHLTPLKGESLRTTINNLVSINELDKKCDTSIKMAKKITLLRQDIEKAEDSKNAQASSNTKRKNDLENDIIDIIENQLIDVQNFIDESERIIIKFKGQAEIAKNQKGLKQRIDDFNKKINTKEGIINSGYKRLVENFINRDFYLSKLTNDQVEKINLNKFKSYFRDFSALRRTELNDALSVEEQKMLYALQKDQPSPQILEQMLIEGTCYVCSNDLNEKSRIYMNEKLIPYFRNELNKNDDELNKYDELNSIYLKLEGYLNKFNHFDSNYLQKIIDDIVENENSKRELEFDKDDFIKENGMVDDNDIDNISLETYDNAIRDKSKFSENKINLENKLTSKERELTEIKLTTINKEESSKLKKSKEIEQFGIDLKNVFLEIKKEAYENFASDLEIITNNKFKAFSEDNSKFKNQSIKVDFSINHAGNPDFEIKVIDQVGNNLKQGGGASQALRQLAVIFGLIEKAGGNVDYPFIADAPTSNMTHTLSEHFFNYQLKNATTQNILITKELWNDQNNTLNDIGERILKNIEEIENAKMISIVFNENEKKKVRIENLKNI